VHVSFWELYALSDPAPSLAVPLSWKKLLERLYPSAFSGAPGEVMSPVPKIAAGLEVRFPNQVSIGRRWEC
jgi:hypothetical protein